MKTWKNVHVFGPPAMLAIHHTKSMTARPRSHTWKPR